MKAKVEGKIITYKSLKMTIDDLLDKSFYELSNQKASIYLNDSYGVNEVFINLVQPYIALQNWIDNNNPSRIVASKADFVIYCYIKDICSKTKTYVEGTKEWRLLLLWIKYKITIAASAFYFGYRLLFITYKPEVTSKDNFAVLRTKASIKKYKKFSEISQEIESIFEKDTIYRLFPKWKRLKWAFKAYRNAIKSFHEMVKFYEPLMGKYFKFALMDFYKKRIVYAELYRLMMDEYLSNFEGKKFYTGNNLDRYSVIEDQLCKKYHIKSYNIPHGIEYGFKFPKGFSSDVFYVHSQYTADYLNKLYKTKKYVYNESIIRRLFEYHCDKPHEKMIIFFTEPREVNVNIEIINGLLPKLEAIGKKLYLKLHPGDNRNNYEGMHVEYITDYELSLTGNICISRKSTILLEAIYNQSLPIAIITNVKDQTMFDLFPSLNAKEIKKTYSVDELYCVIKENIR